LADGVEQFTVRHGEKLTTPDGVYSMDATVRFRHLGIDFLVLVECKRLSRPVEREDVQVLADKLRAAGAQKGVFFATNGFQRGALEYAHLHRIALVRVAEGSLTYETRSLGSERPKPPPWANIPPYVGFMYEYRPDGGWASSVIEPMRAEPLREFLLRAA